MSNRTRSERKKRSQTASLRHFKRLLGYVWPQRRYLIPLIISVVGLAVTYSLSIASILPTLAVIVGEEGLHGRIDREIAQQRFKISLAGYSRYRDNEVAGVNEGDALVTNVEPGSPLAKAGMHRGDFILSVNGRRGSLVTIVDRLADAPTGASLDLEILTQDETRTTTAVAGERSGLLHLGRRVVGLMPGGLSPGERMHTLGYVMVLLLALLVVSNISLLAARYLTVLVCARAIMDLRRQLYTHVLNLPMSRFSQNTSDMMSRFVQDMQEVFRGLSNFFEQVVAEPLKAFGVITVALFIQPRVTLIVLVAAPIAALIFREFGKKIRRANRKLLAGYGQMLGAIESSLNGMRVVKGYTREDYERKRLFRIDRRMLKQQLRLGLVEALASPVIELLGFAAAAALVMWFASQVAYGQLEIQSFVAMLICFGAVFQPVRKLSKVYPKVQRASAAGERLFEIIDSPSEYQRDHLMVSLQPIRESIEFRGITFGYPDAKRPAVNRVNLHVRQGESIAIVGPNGCGKTTLVSLLPRFFEPSHGQILIDGQDIA
ncbi:MAG: ATP-binding cassette domain-containing protein, partial [Phycisphaerae bacterium]|nr:ATP-binding cassette domain-containing protein [Phycisphaerae bacterium]